MVADAVGPNPISPNAWSSPAPSTTPRAPVLRTETDSSQKNIR